jgi:hypothetical protein
MICVEGWSWFLQMSWLRMKVDSGDPAFFGVAQITDHHKPIRESSDGFCLPVV